MEVPVAAHSRKQDLGVTRGPNSYLRSDVPGAGRDREATVNWMRDGQQKRSELPDENSSRHS
jgi:hypothetical protein